MFDNDGCPEYWLSSADWMPRNLDRRVEIAFPILEPALQADIREVLEIQLADSVKARVLGADGRARRRATSAVPLRSQERLYEVVACRGR